MNSFKKSLFILSLVIFIVALSYSVIIIRRDQVISYDELFDSINITENNETRYDENNTIEYNQTNLTERFIHWQPNDTNMYIYVEPNEEYIYVEPNDEIKEIQKEIERLERELNEIEPVTIKQEDLP